VKLFGLVDRLVVREVVPPTILGFITYTFLVLVRGLYSLLEQVLVRGVSLADAGRVLLITVPHVVVLTIPMSFLFGVLLGIGRMNTDNELVALQAGGIPVRRLLRPIVILGLLLTAMNGYLYLKVMPGSGRDLRDLKVKLFAGAKNLGHIEPGVFHEEIPNVLLYVKEVDNDTGEWRDIMFFDNSSPGEERLTLAKRGQMVTAGLPEMVDANLASGELPEMEQWIRLEDVVTHQFMRVEPETYRVNRNRSQLMRPNTQGQGKVRYRLGIGERDTAELVSFVRGGELDGADAERETEEDRESLRRLASIELNKRLAIPFACTVFALLALPLGVGARSGGRSRGFVVSIAVVLTYYLVMNQGEMLAIEGRVPPWIGMWLPNIVLTIAAFAFMRRMGRWMGERDGGDGLVGRGITWWRSWRKNLKQRRHLGSATTPPISGSIPLNVQRRRYATRFPALFDRYITRRLVPPLLLVLGSSALLYIVIDLSDRVEDMAKNHVPADVILAYYANLVPQVFLDVTPMALMIAVLILLSVLERQNELTALKAAGISLYRLIVPILLIAAVSAAGLWVLGEIVVPDANREAKRLRDRITGHEATRSYRSSDRQWLMSRDDETLYNFLRYDSSSETLIRFTLFRIDEDMNLRSHLYTRRARYLNGQWIADSGWFRQIYPDGNDEFRRITGPMKLDIMEGPEYFGQEYRRPSEMSIHELRDYIDELVDSGYRPSNLIVRWHQKLTYPLSAFVMILLALPFGLSRGGRRTSPMQGVAIALVLGIAYTMLVMLFGKLGEVEILPPLVGAWAPFVLALLFGINRLTDLRT
jgi:LPS export ABC transporter permease LptG/LPS export ABC transporter permease LptF